MAQETDGIQSGENGPLSFDNEITELTRENNLFSENIYACLPMGIEIYDIKGVLRSINDSALKMYGVSDRNTVIGYVNLFNSPYMDENLKSKIQSGEDITLEFEYDFDRINELSYYTSQNTSTMIYEAKVVAVRNKAGKIIGHMLLTNDVTSIKKTEFRTDETKKNLEMAMDAANMSSWVYDVHKKTFSSLYGSPFETNYKSLNELTDRKTMLR